MDKNKLAETVAAAREGNKSAFEVLYNEYRDRLYFFVLKNIGSREAAEDITQETFLRSMEKLSELAEPVAYESWLHSIAYRKCLDCLAEGDRAAYFSSDSEREAAVESTRLNEPFSLPEDYAVSEELKGRLKREIDRLRPDVQSAVILYYYDELPVSEVAKTLGTSESAVKQKLFRARRRLRSRLERFSEGELLAVPVGSLLRESIDPPTAAAFKSGGTVVNGAMVGRIVGISAAAVVVVGVPLGLSMGKELDGGLIGDVQFDSEYYYNEDGVQTKVISELVQYYPDSQTMLVINDLALCYAKIPDESLEEFQLSGRLFLSGMRFEIEWSGNFDRQSYPDNMLDVVSVKYVDNGSNRMFVEQDLDALLDRCRNISPDEWLLHTLIENEVLQYELETGLYPNYTEREVEALVYLIENELTSGAEDTSAEDISMYEGFTITDSEWDGNKITFTVKNETDMEFTYGSKWELEKKVDGEWQSVPSTYDGWTTEGYVLEPNGEQEVSLLTTEWGISRYETGQYRLYQRFKNSSYKNKPYVVFGFGSIAD